MLGAWKPLDKLTDTDVVVIVEAGTLEYEEKLYASAKTQDEGPEKLRQEAMREVAGRLWGAGGRLYFWLRRADLLAARFDRVVFD